MSASPPSGQIPPPRFGSLRETAIAGLALAAIGAAAYEFYEAGLYQPNILAQGHAAYTDGNSHRVTAATRQIQIGKSVFWQVELSPGVWKDCGADCAGTLRKAAAAD
ncbi:MAG: hypothetical protein ACLPWS_15445 [Rhodomicrobium sp.]